MQKLKEANEKVAEKQTQIKEDKEVLAKKIDELKDELSKQEVNLLTLMILTFKYFGFRSLSIGKSMSEHTCNCFY